MSGQDPGSERQQGEPAAATAPASDPGLEKIRDILFGERARLHDAHLKRIEERMGRELQALREEQERRAAAQEERLKRELEALQARSEGDRRARAEEMEKLQDTQREQLLAERRERAEAFERLSLKVDEVLESLGVRVAQLEKRSLREEQRLNQATEGLEKNAEAVRELRLAKMDRSAFAAVLNELTAGLTGGAAEKP